MKWIIRILAGLLAFLLGLIAIVRLTTKYHTAEDLENLFLEDQEAFCEAKNVLLDMRSKHPVGITISSDNFYAQFPESHRHVVQIGSLFFTSSVDCYSQQEYNVMYKAVAPLFLQHDLDSIAINTKAIVFCASLSYGVECDIIYRVDGDQPVVFWTIEDQVDIGDGWYAIISTD